MGGSVTGQQPERESRMIRAGDHRRRFPRRQEDEGEGLRRGVLCSEGSIQILVISREFDRGVAICERRTRQRGRAVVVVD
jgi:hypothetical protein